jgi:hypothetical protein
VVSATERRKSLITNSFSRDDNALDKKEDLFELDQLDTDPRNDVRPTT